MRWLTRWWSGLSLRAGITVVATALFTLAVATGALLLIVVLRLSLIRELDAAADRSARAVAALVQSGTPPQTILAGSSGVVEIQVVDDDDEVLAYSPGADKLKSVLTPSELARARTGDRISVDGARFATDEQLRITAYPAGTRTVLVATGMGRVEASERILGEAALVGAPVAVLAMALLTWSVVGLALRPVRALRHGAEEITAAGLADQRLPVPRAQDEIQRLAVTLNAMLDRIDTATARQRTFVGDAAHELRSPLASLQVQLEVAGRLGPVTDWDEVVADALVDVGRLDRLVGDLLALARLDESGGALRRREQVALDEVVTRVVAGYYGRSRVPVVVFREPASVEGDPDALRRIVVNLVDNGVRHAAGEVRVRVGPGLLTVADDGPGIPQGDLERVFDRFYRGDVSRSRESGGTGLGLSIVRDLVRAHGGTVRLRNASPGLVAEVALPVASTDGDDDPPVSAR